MIAVENIQAFIETAFIVSQSLISKMTCE